MQSEERAFFQAVETRILTHRGRGYALSGIEAHKVHEWWQGGHPLAMVLAAIDAAARRSARLAHRDGPSFAMIVRCLDELAERRSREGTGGVEPAPDTQVRRGWALLRQLVEDVGQRLEDGPVKQFWRGLWTRLVADEAAGEDAWEFARREDAAVVAELSSAVPAEIFASAVKAAENTADFHAASRRAQAELLQRASGHAIRSFLGLPELLEALLYP